MRKVPLLHLRGANIGEIVYAVRGIYRNHIIFNNLANIEAFPVLFQLVILEPFAFVAGDRIIDAAQRRRLLLVIIV